MPAIATENNSTSVRRWKNLTCSQTYITSQFCECIYCIGYCCVRCTYYSTAPWKYCFPTHTTKQGWIASDATYRQNTHSTSVNIFYFFIGLHIATAKLRCEFWPFWGKKSARHALYACYGTTHGFWYLFYSLHSTCSSSTDDNDYNTPEWILLCSYQTLFVLSMHTFSLFSAFHVAWCATLSKLPHHVWHVTLYFINSCLKLWQKKNLCNKSGWIYNVSKNERLI